MATKDSRNESSVRRIKYKELLDLGSKIEATTENESAAQTLKKITAVAQRSDELNAQGRHQDRLENTTEVVMDAQVMKMTHELLGSIVQSMNNAEISDEEFVAAFNRVIGPNKDWNNLADFAVRGSKTITYSQPLFGTFDEETVIQPKEKKERRRNATGKNTQQVKPISVTQQNKKDEEDALAVNVVGAQINQLFEHNNHQPLPYYHLIIDPGNFMRTIQNAFQVSFLLRDSIIVIEEDEFGYPTVRPSNDIDKNETYDDSSHQMVSNISMKLCDEMIRRYNITEPMLAWSASTEDEE